MQHLIIYSLKKKAYIYFQFYLINQMLLILSMKLLLKRKITSIIQVIELVIIFVQMRPKSAISKRTPQHKKVQDSRYNPLMLRTQYLQINSRISKNHNLSRSSARKMTNVRTVNSVKNIGLIHAYQPQLLKNCLMKNKKSYNNYFSKAGDCKSPDIFLKSIITHFRQWKKDINQRLGLIFNLILTTEYLKEEESQPKIRQILNQLKQFSTDLKQNLQEIVKTKIESPQISQLLQKYEEMQWVIKRVILLIDHLFKFIGEVNKFLSSNKDIDIHDTIKISNQLQALSKRHLKEIVQEMNYCHSLTQNEMLLKLEYKIRQKMVQTNRKTLQIFQSIKNMRQFQKTFKSKLEILQEWTNFDCEYLQNVVQFLYFKNQEIKLNQRKFDINPKIKENIYELRSQIEAIETNFICKFQKKCLEEAKLTVAKLSQLKTLHLVKNRGNQYLEIKKKMLLIVKVLKQSEKQSGIDEQKYFKQKKIVGKYITFYSNAVKNFGGLMQSFTQKIQSSAIFKDKSVLMNGRSLEKSIKEMIEIEQIQKQIWKATKILAQQLCQVQGEAITEIYQNVFTDSKMLIKLNQLLLYSRNQKQNNDIFHIVEINLGENLQKSRKKQQTANHRQNIFDFYASIAKSHQKFLKTGLEQGIIRNNQLKQLNKQQLVQYLFDNEFANQFISNYASIKNITSIIDKLNVYVQKQQISQVQFCLISCKTMQEYRLAVNQQIKNMQKSKFKSTFNKYIVLLYENSLIKFLNIPYIAKLQTMRNQSVDTSDYSKILEAFIQVYEKVLSITKKDNNIFSETVFQMYEIVKNIHSQNNFIKSYNQSFRSGVYYPCFQIIKELIELQYSVQIEETLTRSSTKVRRQQIKAIFAYCIKKLQAVRQKIKLKLLLNEKHAIYQDINKSLALLKSITFEQDYIALLNKLLILLRVKQIRHSALFSQDSNAVYLLPHLQSIHDANTIIYSYLHSHSAQSVNVNLLINMNFDDSKDILKYKDTDTIIQTKQNQINRKQLIALKKQENRNKNQDQMNEQIVCEQSGIQIESIIKQSIIQSLIQQESSKICQKSQKPSKNQNTIKQAETQKAKHYSYYTIKSIKNIEILKKCMVYRNNQNSFIKNKLQLSIICNLNTIDERKKAITHIQQLLLQLRQSDLLRRMGVECEQPQCQSVLKLFQKALKLQININQNLQRTIEHFHFKKQLIFSKGSNKIQLIHQDNKLPYIRILLTENNYKINIAKMQVSQFLNFFWQQIKISLQLNTKPQFTLIKQKYNNFIEPANKKLKAYYLEIQDELQQKIKMKHSNSKQNQLKIDSFMRNVVGCQSYLPYFSKQLTSLEQILNIVTQLSTNITKIKIIDPIYQLFYKQQVLYFAGQKISQEEIFMCIMLNKSDHFNLPLQNNLIQMLSYDKWLSQIKQQLQRTPLCLQLVRQLINQQTSMQKQVIKVKQKMSKLNKLICQILLLKITQPQLYNKMSAQLDNFKKQMELYSFIEKLHSNKKIPKFISFQTNNNLKYNDKVYNISKNRHLDHIQLTQLYQKLIKNNIQCFQLYYKHKLIGLLQQLSIQQAAKLLNINLQSNVKQNFKIQPERVIINNLNVILANVVPKNSQKDKQIVQKINQFLKSTTVQISIDTNIQRYDCYDLLNNKNKLQLEVDWYKSAIHFKLTNSQQEIKLTISPHNYLFFMQIEPISLQKIITQKYKQIREDVFQKRLQMERIRQSQRIQKLERLKQAEKKEAQRQLEILQIQQKKLKIKLENQQIHTKMRNMEEQKLRKVRQEIIKRQQEELRKKKQKQEQQARIKRQKQRIEQLQRKRQQFIQKLNDKTQSHQNQHSQLDISVILSQGKSVRNIEQANLNFPGFSKLKECKQHIEYELTLSQDNFKSKKKTRAP